MTHTHGTRLHSVASVEDLRQRCVIDAAGGCWHFRTSSGRAPTPGKPQKLWLYGGTITTPTRAMWAFHTGAEVPSKKVVYRTCFSLDCINPAHLKCGLRRHAARLQCSRHERTPAQQAALRATSDRRTVVTRELLTWVLESTQTGAEAAHALGISQSRVNILRRRERDRLPQTAASIFTWGAALGTHHQMRARA